MGFQVSPGVAVSEIDLTTIIPAVSTSTGASAIHSIWGPAFKRVLIDTQDNLALQFGSPNANTYQDFFPASNFLDYSNQLYVVRVVRGSNTATLSTDTVASRNATTNAANTKNTVVYNEDVYALNYNSSGITGVGQWIAKYPGELGNALRVSQCPSANAWQSSVSKLKFTANSVAFTMITNGVNANNLTNILTVGDILLAGPDKLQVQVATVSANSGTLSSAYSGNTTSVAGTTTTRHWEFFNQFDSAPGTSDFVAQSGGTSDESHIVVVDRTGRITGTVGAVLERFSKVSRASDAQTSDGTGNYYKDVINNTSKWIWWARHATSQTNAGKASQGAAVAFGAGITNTPISLNLTQGRDGATPRDADYINGYNMYLSPEDVDVSIILSCEANQTRALNLVNLVESRKDCIFVLSPRRSDVVNNSGYVGSEMDSVIAFRNLLGSTSYGTMDSGFKYQYDKYNDVYRYVSLNGDVAGTMARTDQDRDPWYSPAGFNRGQIKNVIKLAYNPPAAQRDQLYKSGINPVVTFPGQGTVLFGDKTLLAKPSAFDRINVRRLFIVLEKAIAIAAKFSLFEFNDEFTRAQFRNLVEPFLRDVQGRRGIYDFRVICDETNNTPEVIDGNRFVGDIYIKPARSINFIQLNFVAVRTGVDFTEIVGKF